MADPVPAPTLGEIEAAAARLAGLVRETPVWEWRPRGLAASGTRVVLKLELLQVGGSFKARGAVNVMKALGPSQLARGVTAVSSGNHAIAVAYAARVLGTTAKVVMPRTANPARVDTCRAEGAEVVLAADVHAAFVEAQRIEREEGRTFVHPFEGPGIAVGTATLGLEIVRQVPDVDTVLVPIGGGGLCAGIACALAQQKPGVKVIGVEPDGADSMHRSFAAGEPRGIDAVRTIADSLGAPYALPYSFELCRRYTAELVRVDDQMLRAAMRLLFAEAKLAVEPAGAATTAALLGPLRGRPLGTCVAIVCGTNIDPATFGRLVAEG
jgi:threonine dehydratase